MKSFLSLFGNAFGGLSRSIWLLAFTQFVNRSGSMVVFFLSVYLKDELNFSLGQVGFIMSVFGAGSLLGVYLGGKLVDKLGYYPIMLFSLFAGGIMFLVVGNLSNFVLLCSGLFVLSTSGEAFRPAGMVAISHYSTPENYTRSVSLYRLAINLGFSIGPAIGGLLASINYRLIFWADGITCILAACCVLFFLSNKEHHEKKELNHESAAEKKSGSPFRDKAYMFFIPMVTLFAIAFFQMFTTMALYYKNVEGLTEGQIGMILALNGLIVAAFEMILIYKIEKRGTVFSWILLGAILLLTNYVLLLFVHGIIWLIIITVIISLSEMFAMPFMNTFMNQRAGLHNKGQYASLYVMSWSVAQIATPLISTQVADHYGYRTLWIVLASFAILVMIALRFVVKYAHK